VRHGHSYNACFQSSSYLLWHPNNADGGLRLQMVEEAIKHAMALLMVEGALGYLRDLGDKCYTQLIKIPHFGGTLGQQCIQMSAWLGLIPVAFCEFTTIDCSASSKSVPALCLRKTCHCCDDAALPSICQCSAVNIKERFCRIIDTLIEHRLVITDHICVQTASIAWRLFRSHDNCKPELLF
jgi:hypothetical protein